MRSTRFRIFLGVLWTASLFVLGLYAVRGLSYYLTPLALRPRHPDFWSLKPGGSIGHGLGIFGSTLMVLLLVYSLRKRWKRLRKLGQLSRWLDVHIWMGSVGPLFVILHSSFKVRGLVALSFWSMIAVAASGVLGRYLYLQIPRTRAGDEMSLEQMQQRDAEITERLKTGFGVDEAVIEQLQMLTAPRKRRRRTLVGSLFGALADDVALPFRVRRAMRDVALPRDVGNEFRRCLRTKFRLARRIEVWASMQRLFHYWHVVHKPFAVVMYIFMVVHVVVALMTGYGWGVGR